MQLKKSGEMGIGTLIIFISLLLVAAVAAGVLIQSSGQFQQQALSTGDAAQSQISTNMVAVEVSAMNASDNNDVENFSMIMKLAPGSQPIKLNDSRLALNTEDSATDYNYDTVSDTVSGTENFTVEYLEQQSDLDDRIHNGDLVKLHFNAPQSIGEEETVIIKFIPKSGTPTTVEFTTPDVMSDTREYLYP